MKELSKKLVATAMVASCMFSMAPALAVNMENDVPEVVSEDREPNSFSRNYKDKFLKTVDYNYFMNDGNWLNETTVTVYVEKFNAGDMYINLYTRASSKDSWSYQTVSGLLSAGDEVTFDIPKGYQFRVGARAYTKAGNADFIVSLS